MTIQQSFDPDLEWLSFVAPIGLVVAPNLLKDLGLAPVHQTQSDTAAVLEFIQDDLSKPSLVDPWAFVENVLGWEARYVAGSPKGPEISSDLFVPLREHDTTLKPTWAVKELGNNGQHWQLLVRVEDAGVDPDARSALSGWEATSHQRFERLLRDTGVFAGLLFTDNTLRLVYAPRGETSGYINFPLRDLGSVAGRPMLGGLKLLLDSFRLFADANDRRLSALLKKSRETQAAVSTALAEQVLGALHELLRGLDAAEPILIRDLTDSHPDHIYEGLLAVLMRLVFILYAEDRDLLPSRKDGRARGIYESSYSVRGLYAKLVEDATLNPDTMDERRGGWGRLMALFRLIYAGHPSGFIRARGGKLFDPDEFPFLEGRTKKDAAARIVAVSDGCLLRILEGLMTLKLRGENRERLSYRTLDVEQIGSVYETVMGFTVEKTCGHAVAIKAGKNNRTPVFIDLDNLIAQKGTERIKLLKETAGRQLTDTQAKPVKAAASVAELLAAFDNIIDLRGSPNSSVIPPGLPILQPTDERRRTGSHYTPRSLTGPIVRHALEPAFERLGDKAAPEQILDLKVCDPAMGSGAFLVEACRVIGERLVQAWMEWPDTRPKIPADEDEDLHARRLVAQRCLYGVDKNPRAVDLARLSLWLATLAHDHEFTFLDHALKCGDSLVGLTQTQISALNWDESKPGLPLFRQLVRERVDEALRGRVEIREAPDDVTRAIQEVRYKTVEQRLAQARLIGDAVIAAFLSADKPKIREKKRQEIEGWLQGAEREVWDRLNTITASLRDAEQPFFPFHWEIEFPEVFVRESHGFDAIIGNPPFLGGTKISGYYGKSYLAWLLALYLPSHGNADLVSYFFRLSFRLLGKNGCLGLMATNTIGQGDTRNAGLTVILKQEGTIINVIRRLKWPGEAAVIVSVIHIAKGDMGTRPIMLDGRKVNRISAYLVDSYLDNSPAPLVENERSAFMGTKVYGAGFTFDDVESRKGASASLEDMKVLVEKNSKNLERIIPYIGGEDINGNSEPKSDRYVIDFGNFSEIEIRERWPDLVSIVEPRLRKSRGNYTSVPWWQFERRRPELYTTIKSLSHVFILSRVSPHLSLVRVPNQFIYADSCVVFAFSSFSAFSVLQSRVHELWARYFSSTLEERLRYTPSDCFKNFPFPENYKGNPNLEETGKRYYNYRATLMVKCNVGTTKIYNRFHDHNQNNSEIVQLRALHAEIDTAALRAYGWEDLADRAISRFIEQEPDEGKTPKTRFDWPSEFKDEVLTRLLSLNAARAAAERAAGLTASIDEGEDEDNDEENSE